jgi:hypothetical protein
MQKPLKVPVVYYHSVGEKIPGWNRNFLTNTNPESFEDHLVFFKQNYNIISLKDFWLIQNGYAPRVKKPLIITFDDGYADNWLWVFPLVKKYDAKITIFISPEFMDGRNIIRQTSDHSGFLSWDEMRIMEESGLVDIESHTLTHTKYFVSDRITDFHHPGADILYAAGNIYPEKKPYHIGNPDFEKLLPYGFPLFEERSSIIARKATINQDFIDECVFLLKNFDFKNYIFEKAYKFIEPLYLKYKREKSIITATESDEEYLSRIKNEISGSKTIIEEKLNKKVEFLCWPHGDNNEELHQMALAAGYLMTTKGKANVPEDSFKTRIPERVGVEFFSWRKKIKTILKLKGLSGQFPYSLFLSHYRAFRY